MRKLLLALFFAVAFCAPVKAAGWLPLVKPAPPCSQATTFLARTSGLSLTETNAYTNLICGMVADGTWCGTTLDALYIFATNTTTTANLNLCSTSYGLTQNFVVTFSADHGYTGNGSSGYLDTGFNPTVAAGNYALNSASIGAYVLTSRTASQAYAEFGVHDGSEYSYMRPLQSGSANFDINGATFPTGTSANAQGSYLATRTSNTTVTLYKNGSSVGSSAADASVSLPNADITLLIIGGLGSYSADQVSAAWFGAGVNSTVAANIQSRVNAYMTTLGINVY
jgi:hypothetical protein